MTQPALTREVFCERWAEIDALQAAGDRDAAAMELARLSEQEPPEIADAMEQLYGLLEDRLAGRDVDFDVMADASLAVYAFCGAVP